jgi:hypothetical protein
MPATALRKHSWLNEMARHRTLRRAMASASAKMPRRQCVSEGTDRSSERRAPSTSAPGRRVRRFSIARPPHTYPRIRDETLSPPSRLSRRVPVAVRVSRTIVVCVWKKMSVLFSFFVALVYRRQARCEVRSWPVTLADADAARTVFCSTTPDTRRRTISSWRAWYHKSAEQGRKAPA